MRGIVWAMALTLSAMAWAANGDMGNGDGSEQTPYLIEDVNDFDAFADPATAATYWAAGVHTQLMTDIDLSGRTYQTAVIAPDTDNTTWDYVGTPFTGTFNGNSHAIRNLTIDTSGTNNKYYIGLFGQIRSGAEISNLRMEDVTVTGGTDNIGGLCGSNGDWDYAGGTISDCYFSGNVTGGIYSDTVGGLVGLNYYGIVQNCQAVGFVSAEDYFGGMVGWNYYGTITNCYSSAEVSNPDSPYAIGGIVGYNEYGEISDCNSNATVSGGVNSYAVGGIVGENDTGNVSNCYATGTVDADGGIGNIVGENMGTVRNCYSNGIVIGKSYSRIGGLVGYNYFGIIIQCYANDTVIAGDNSYQLGGLVGWNNGTILNCYSTGSVTGGINSRMIGGLVGSNGHTITNCYASGKVSSGTGSSNLGGLCGYQTRSTPISPNINNCFWDTETSGTSTGYNLDATSPGTITNVVGKTTTEMMTISTFTLPPASWDFTNETTNGTNDYWMLLREGEDYPRLAWQAVFAGDVAGLYGVDLADFAYLANYWGQDTCFGTNLCGRADIDVSNDVGLGDLVYVADDWLK